MIASNTQLAQSTPQPTINKPYHQELLRIAKAERKHVYEHLLDIVEATPPYAIDGVICDSGGRPTGKKATDSIAAAVVTERQLCDMIQLDVLGELKNGKIKVFSEYHRKSRIVESIAHLKYENLLQLAGPPAKEHVLPPGSEDNDSNDTFPVSDYRNAIALLAGYRFNWR